MLGMPDVDGFLLSRQYEWELNEMPCKFQMPLSTYQILHIMMDIASEDRVLLILNDKTFHGLTRLRLYGFLLSKQYE